MVTELKFTEKLLICILKNFNQMFYDYKISSLAYNDRDGDIITYEGHGKRNRHFKIEIWYGLGNLHIIISKPKNIIETLKDFLILLLSVLGIKYFKKKIKPNSLGIKSFDIKEAKRLLNIEDKTSILNELTYEDVIFADKNFIEQYLSSVLKGEMWIDELINKNKTILCLARSSRTAND